MHDRIQHEKDSVAASQQLSLFGAGGIPAWRPDETLYSLASRYHELSGIRDPRETSRRLFGRRRGGAQHDFPSGIGHFAATTRGCLGDARSIALERTPIRFYLPFRRPEDREHLLDIAVGDRNETLKARLGLPAGGCGAWLPLKACLGCLEEDEASFEAAHWRLTQQLPSSLVCLKHRQLLWRDNSKSPLLNRYAWVRPHHHSLEPICAVPPDSVSPIATSMTIAGIALLAPGFAIDPSRCTRATFTELRRRGLLTANGSIRVSELAPAYQRMCGSLRLLGMGLDAPSDLDSARTRLTTLLRVNTLPMQPVSFLLACLLVFESWDKFTTVYEATTTDDVAPQTPPVKAATGKSGPRARRVPRTMSSLVTALADNGTVRKAASSLGWGRQRFQAVLKANPSIRRQAQAICIRREKTEMRQDFLEFRRLHPAATTKAVRARKPATYAWLYRNDRCWLVRNSPARQIAFTNHSQIDWIERDKQLADRVTENAERIRATAGKEHPTRRHVALHVPTIRISSLSRLPETRRAMRKLGIRLRGDI